MFPCHLRRVRVRTGYEGLEEFWAVPGFRLGYDSRWFSGVRHAVGLVDKGRQARLSHCVWNVSHLLHRLRAFVIERREPSGLRLCGNRFRFLNSGADDVEPNG